MTDALLAGLGLGLCVASALGISAVLGGREWPVSVYWLVVSTCVGAVPFVVFLARGTVGAFNVAADMLERWRQLNPAPTVTVYETEAEDAAAPVPAEALADAWYTVLRVFFRNGEVAEGFSHSRLVEVGRTLSEGDWTELTHFYASEAGGGVLRLEPQGYVLGHGWTHDFIRQCIVRRTLPYPAGSPPEVVPLPADTTRHDARRRPTARKAEGVNVT